MNLKTRTLTIACALPLCLTLPACLDLARIEGLRDDFDTTTHRLSAQESYWQSHIDDLESRGVPPNDPRRIQAESALARAKAASSIAAAAQQHLTEVLTEASDPSSPVGQTVGVLAPMVPGPWQAPILLGTALAVTAARAWQLKRGLTSVADSIEKAKSHDPTFAAKFTEHADTLRAVQTKAAKRIVDEATKDRFMVRLPV